MAVTNPVFKKLVDAISPIVSIGVGSAVIKVCMQKGLDPNALEQSHVPVLRNALLEHYKRFWEAQLADIEKRLKLV